MTSKNKRKENRRRNRNMPKLADVKWFKNPKNLSEIYQQTGTVFAFASLQKEGLTQCHEWVKCRDFLPDAVRSQMTGKMCSIYGFVFDPKNNPNIDLDKIRMLVSKGSLNALKIQKFRRKIKSSLELLNHFEDIAEVSKTKVVRINSSGQKKYKAVFLFSGPPMWLSSPFLVSMYTFLIRLGDKELKFTDNSELEKELKTLVDQQDAGKLNDNDACYLKNSWNKLKLIIENCSELFPTQDNVHDVYWKDYTINEFHNRSGLNSLTRYCTIDPKLNITMKEFMSKALPKKPIKEPLTAIRA